MDYIKPEIATFDKEELARYIMAAACSNGWSCGCNSGSNNMSSDNSCQCNSGSNYK